MKAVLDSMQDNTFNDIFTSDIHAMGTLADINAFIALTHVDRVMQITTPKMPAHLQARFGVAVTASASIVTVTDRAEAVIAITEINPVLDAKLNSDPTATGATVIDILNVQIASTVDGSLSAIARGEGYNRTGPRADHRAYGRGAKLTYLKGNDGVERNNGSGGEVKHITLDPAVTKERLESIGKARFDTALVRNMFFITNVVRLVRLKLNRELTKSRNVLVASHFAVSPGVTEYGSDPFGPNEADESMQYNGYARFDDADEVNRF
jgi:hypothetical protein